MSTTEKLSLDREPIKFYYLQTTSCFLLSFPLGPTALALYTYILCRRLVTKRVGKQAQDGFAGRMQTTVIITRIWRDNMRQMT
jgi:hypothetical protein